MKRSEAIRIFLVAIVALLTWLGAWAPFRGFAVIPLIVALFGGYPIFREALSSLGRRKMTMELSMTIAILAALAIGESFTSLVIVLFVLIAEVLEHLTMSRGRRAVAELLRVLPGQSTVLRGGATREIPINELRRGDLVLVRPGARIPVDGLVMSGYSFVDQSTITGESIPVEKMPGGKIYAGTINQSGTLQVQTLEVGPDTAFGKIIEAVEKAEQSRAPIQKTSDRLAGFLVYFALAAAVLTFLATRDIRSTIAVVIVAGACGIAAGTPLAIFGAIGRAAKSGAIIKGGLHLEALWRVDTILLDKTGTLTLGKPEVVELRPGAGVTEVELLQAAAIAEGPSEHPLARSILAKAKSMGVLVSEAEAFDYTPGEGIACLSEGGEIVVGNRLFLRKRGIDPAGCPPVSNHLSEVLVARQKRPPPRQRRAVRPGDRHVQYHGHHDDSAWFRSNRDAAFQRHGPRRGVRHGVRPQRRAVRPRDWHLQHYRQHGDRALRPHRDIVIRRQGPRRHPRDRGCWREPWRGCRRYFSDATQPYEGQQRGLRDSV